MVNDDNNHEVPAEANLGGFDQLYLTPSISTAKTNSTFCPTNNGSSFSLELSEIFINPKLLKFKRVLWKKGYLQFNVNQFRDDSDLTDDIKALQTLFKVWCHLFPQLLQKDIVKESLRYAGVDKSFSFTVSDLHKVIGTLFCTPLLQTTTEVFK